MFLVMELSVVDDADCNINRLRRWRVALVCRMLLRVETFRFFLLCCPRLALFLFSPWFIHDAPPCPACLSCLLWICVLLCFGRIRLACLLCLGAFLIPPPYRTAANNRYWCTVENIESLHWLISGYRLVETNLSSSNLNVTGP